MDRFIKLLGGYRVVRLRIAFIVIALVLTSLPLVFAKTSATKEEEPLTEKTTIETTTETTTEETTNPNDFIINVGATSVEKDIRIRFYKLDWTLHTGIKFEVDVKDSSGAVTHYVDDDMDGRINITDVKPGNATITMTEVENYSYKANPITVKVKDHVEYKPVEHIAADVAKTSNDDVVKKVEESKLVDTVEFVESTKTEHKEYVLVDNLSILDPTLVEEDTTGETEGTTEATDTTENNENTESTTTVKRLLDKDGNELYLKTGDSYSPAYEPDYSAEGEFYKLEITYSYTGWQNIEGKVYYFDKNGDFVTGTQVIQGVSYKFAKSGVRGGTIGVDISKYQGTVDWKKVKESGIDFAIIRVGYRGWGSGTLVWDSTFEANIAGANATGVKVGVYFYSQAISEAEAVEEASVCIEAVSKYKIDLPIFIDTENTGTGGQGRADNISKEMRTKVCLAFCKTVVNAGYKAGVYANKTYLLNNLNASSLKSYYIWVADWNGKDSTSYTGKYDFWQYTSSGKVNGISGNVDMNYNYS